MTVAANYNLFDNPGLIFNCPYAFTERFSGAEDYFKPREDVEPDPVRGLAMLLTEGPLRRLASAERDAIGQRLLDMVEKGL